MECVVVAILLFAAVIVGAILLGLSPRWERRQWNEAFRHVARRFHGVLNSGGWFHEPSAWLQHGHAHGRLTIYSLRGSGGERCLQMTMQQRDIQSRCEISHRDTRPGLAPLPSGLAPVEFDWTGFSNRWKTLSDNADDVRHLLSDGVRMALELLWRNPVPAEIAISVSPGWLVVRKVWHSPRGVDVEAFVEHVCALSDQLNLAASSGIEFVVSEEPQLLEDSRCGVCGDALAMELVVCRRCNTPHHRECWEYGGGCATYGCGGRECTLPGIAPLARPHWNGQAAAVPRPVKPR